MNYKLFILIIITLFFFSTSSILARAALVENYIDAFSFTFIRLLSGAIILLILLYFKQKRFDITLKKNWISSFMLFLYAIAFSYSYLNLDAGLGALILFAVVQLFIILVALLKKESLTLQKSIGIFIAFAGLTYLLFPEQSFSLSFYHVFLMIIAGLAWGAYTILGKGTTNALQHTADNFLKSLVFVSIFYLLFVSQTHISFNGIILAFISGGITSALGYAIWYHILPQIQIITSGIIQLIVPPIAIFLGVLLLNEELTFKLFISTDIILTGIAIAILSKRKTN
ncbi:DMT family transporter [Arcobacter sp. LA11]|uniref:DMT family transporter n=1 Tax=Arcobacter sp. LA11 TaxID=1898176 RepID=UPI0009FA219F|nr:DMT family transporter [Arcobacter sp. LA11]